MKCPLRTEDNLAVLLDYSAGRLAANEAIALEKHMLACARCAAYKADQAEVWLALDAWEAPPVSMAFNRRVLRAVEERARAPWYTKLAEALRFSAWKPAFPLAAAVALMVAGFVFDHQGAATGTRGAIEISGVTVSDVDQVERTLDDIQLLRQFDAAATARPM